MRLLRYLKLGPEIGVNYLMSESIPLLLKGFFDADWAKRPFSIKSLSGYVVYLGGSPNSWMSKKQSTISRSSTETKCRALGSLSCKLIWVLKFLYDIGYKFSSY